MNSKASASLSSDSLSTAIGRGPTPARWHADPQNGWSPAHDVPSHLVSVFCQFHSVHWPPCCHVHPLGNPCCCMAVRASFTRTATSTRPDVACTR